MLLTVFVGTCLSAFMLSAAPLHSMLATRSASSGAQDISSMLASMLVQASCMQEHGCLTPVACIRTYNLVGACRSVCTDLAFRTYIECMHVRAQRCGLRCTVNALTAPHQVPHSPHYLSEDGASTTMKEASEALEALVVFSVLLQKYNLQPS